MKVTQFSTAEPVGWREALARFAPHDDVYFQPEYALAYEANGDGQARAILVTEGNAALFISALRCPIPGSDGACDIQGAYGYGGPLLAPTSPDFLSRAWGAVREIWRGEGAVAAFIRTHPLLGNEDAFDAEWTVMSDRPTMSIDLRAGAEAAFAGPSARKHRRDVAAIQRSGATVHFRAFAGEALEEFRALYARTMATLGAGGEYFFKPAYFATFGQAWPETASLVEVRDPAGTLSSSACILWGTQWAHYHLAGRESAGQKYNTAHLLLQAVAEEAVRRGLTAVHIGGGRTPAPDDSLLQFKRWVGNREHRFCTARQVIDPARYSDLVSDWCHRHSETPAQWFLTYRQPARVPSISV